MGRYVRVLRSDMDSLHSRLRTSEQNRVNERGALENRSRQMEADLNGRIRALEERNAIERREFEQLRRQMEADLHLKEKMFDRERQDFQNLTRRLEESNNRYRNDLQRKDNKIYEIEREKNRLQAEYEMKIKNINEKFDTEKKAMQNEMKKQEEGCNKKINDLILEYQQKLDQKEIEKTELKSNYEKESAQYWCNVVRCVNFKRCLNIENDNKFKSEISEKNFKQHYFKHY